MVKFSVIALFFASMSAWALIPIEGLLLGESKQDLQVDPIKDIFKIQEVTFAPGEVIKVKNYLGFYQEGINLKQSCESLGTGTYASFYEEAQAKRSVVASMQYVGLDLSLNAIADLSRIMMMPREDFSRMTDKLVTQSCSPNVSVYGHKLIRQNFLYAYDRLTSLYPSVETSPFVAEAIKTQEKGLSTRERELHQAIKLFRSFCSWGGDVTDYRLLPPLLSDPFIYAMVVRELEQKKMALDRVTGEIYLETKPDSIKVLCQDQICRRTDPLTFFNMFPRMIGSTGISQDAKRLYCQHFRYEKFRPKDTIPQVQAWIKEQEWYDEKFQRLMFIALLNDVPDFSFTIGQFDELVEQLKIPFEARWTEWANRSLKNFSQDLLFEESLQISVRPQRDQMILQLEKFRVDMDVTMGEVDRVFSLDKISSQLEIQVSKVYLRWLRQEWGRSLQEINHLRQNDLKAQFALLVKSQLDKKQKLFPTRLFGEGLERLVSEELLNQLLIYQGDLFEGSDEARFKIPIKFHYGLFGLSYINFKARAQTKFKDLDLSL